MIELTLPIRTVSESNFHGHWRVRHARVQAQHQVVALLLTGPWRRAAMPLPVVVTFTRIAPRKLDKDDNANNSCKHVRDAVAKVMGVNDGGDSVTWRYAQRRGKPREYAVEVRIEAAS